MRKSGVIGLSAVALSAALLVSVWHSPSMAQDELPPAPEYLHSSDYLRWPLPAGADAKYGAIDGHRMWNWVEEQAKIARDYRDNGHPQFWGRIVGTSGDEADIKWLLGKYRQFGLSDVHAQPVALFDPQWSAKSWSVVATGGGKTIKLESAQPTYGSPATGGKERDLEVVYMGLGSDADFARQGVRGKAILLVKPGTSYQAGAADVLKRAMEGGAAAILSYNLRGGNYKAQAYKAASNVPTFDLGTEDGNKVRSLTAGSTPPLIKIRMDAGWVTGQKSALVWGTLPGMTDETIYVIAHRDGWFEAAGDNASGVATMLGLAEYYSKVPMAQRRRTMIFIGTDGHHQVRPGWYGAYWLAANHDRFFKKTALMFNAEHTAEVLTHDHGCCEGTAPAGDSIAQISLDWYAGGPTRPKLQRIAVDAMKEFGVPAWTRPDAAPGGGDLGPLYTYVPGVNIQSNEFINMHTELDNPATVSWAGLESTTRTYAKIIDEVNKLPLSDLQRPTDRHPYMPTEANINLKNCQAWIKDSSQPCTH